MKSKFTLIMIFTLITSILPDILMYELAGTIPSWIIFVKLIIMITVSIACLLFKELQYLAKYTVVLGSIIGIQILSNFIETNSLWQSIFDKNSFVGNFGSNILLKFVGVIPMIGILILLFKSTNHIYLCKGDLSVKADRISWLGINENTISWGRLSLISAVLISLGTILLTVLTSIGTLNVSYKIENFLTRFPIIILFALFNSFCEGIIFRSAILGSFRTILPKNQVIAIAAVFFGIAHYYGIPSGLLGVIMSGLLGWYMCRSMYETKGFASSWIIHFMQDLVIFSTISMMGSFY